MATSAESPYSISRELLCKYLNIDITEMQLYRITTHYGEALAPVAEQAKCLHPLCGGQQQQECLYAMADGSMILTREENWKEIKLGRIFTEKQCLQTEGKTNSIRASQYVSHLGDSKTFTSKMEAVLDEYGELNERLVFITDGAPWLRNWIEDAYPEAVSVLDFYHAKEYLCQFAKACFGNDTERHDWIEKQEALLLESRTQQVIDEICTLTKTKPSEAGTKVIEYYSSNIKRMDYARYKKIGKGLIGSGAIESAHKTVIQCRMKLSGQRWSKPGAQNMLRLRTIKMNNQWNEVIALIKNRA